MNKVIKISISGCSFAIDCDAHDLLKNYIDSLESKYGTSQENEMVQDIEIRICELLNEKLHSKECVVGVEMVRSVISQIGSVSAIERDCVDTQSGVRFNFKKSTTPIEKGCEYARDTFNTVGRGVSSLLKAIILIFMVIFSLKTLALLVGLVVMLIISPVVCTIIPVIFAGAIGCVVAAIFGSLTLIALLYRVLDRGRKIFSKWATIASLFAASVIVGTLSIVGIVQEASKHSVIGKHKTSESYAMEPGRIDLEIRLDEGGFIRERYDFDEDDEKELFLTRTNDYRNSNSDNPFAMYSEIKNTGAISYNVRVRVREKEDINQVQVETVVSSKAESRQSAVANARNVKVNYRVEGNKIVVDKFVKLPLDGVVGMDNITVYVYVPKGEYRVVQTYTE